MQTPYTLLMNLGGTPSPVHTPPTVVAEEVTNGYLAQGGVAGGYWLLTEYHENVLKTFSSDLRGLAPHPTNTPVAATPGSTSRRCTLLLFS